MNGVAVTLKVLVLKINKSNFKKGNKPWNKGMKGIHLSPESEFKKVQTAGNKNNKWKGGIQKPKNDCTLLYNGTGNKVKRRPREIYKQHHGKISDNHVIYHLNGDKYDDSIGNLIAISRAELVKLNKNKKKCTILKKEIY